jgi:hypothetical protein
MFEKAPNSNNDITTKEEQEKYPELTDLEANPDDPMHLTEAAQPGIPEEVPEQVPKPVTTPASPIPERTPEKQPKPAKPITEPEKEDA